MGILDNPIPVGLSVALAAKVAKGELAIRMADYAPVADGVANDSIKIQAAMNDAAAAGLTLIFNGTKRYNVNTGVVTPAGLRMQTNGCTFVKTVNNSTYVVKTGDRAQIDRLNLEVAGGGSNDAGVWVNGNDTVIDKISVTSLTNDQVGANGLLVGDLTTQKTNMRINSITLTSFRSPMRVFNVADSRISNATINNFMTGVYVINVTDTTFDKFKITGTSPASTGGPGQNGLLLEAQNNNWGCLNVKFRDWMVDGSPEHNYRIGGGLSVGDIYFESCISRNPGNAPGNATFPGGQATGGSAFKALGSATNWHRNIRFINCSAEDGNNTPNGDNNHSAYHMGYVDGLKLIEPRLSARTKTYSAINGLLMFACKNVEVLEPNFTDVLQQAIHLLKDSTEPTPPTGLSNIRITGGLVDTATASIVVNFDCASAVFKDIFVKDLTVSRGGTAYRPETPTLVGSDQGAYVNVNVGINYIDTPKVNGDATGNPPITGGNLTVNTYCGPIYGSFTMPSLDGGFYLNSVTGAKANRKAGAWAAV